MTKKKKLFTCFIFYNLFAYLNIPDNNVTPFFITSNLFLFSIFLIFFPLFSVYYI